MRQMIINESLLKQYPGGLLTTLLDYTEVHMPGENNRNGKERGRLIQVGNRRLVAAKDHTRRH